METNQWNNFCLVYIINKKSFELAHAFHDYLHCNLVTDALKVLKSQF